jgi:AraC-like DNA-binding protein
MGQSTVSIALIRPLIEAANNEPPCSCDNESIKEIHGKITKLLKNPDARLPIADADIYINKLIRNTHKNSLCILPVKNAASQSSCQLQHLFLCSNTLREALHYLEKFSALLCDGLEVNVTRTRDNIIKIKLPVNEHCYLSQERYRSELLISILLSWLDQLCGQEMVISGINLPFPQPNYASDYNTTWNSTTSFNADECSIQFQAKFLDQGLHNTNPHILNMIKRDVEDQYKKLTRSSSLSDRIKRALEQEKIHFSANQTIVAAHFHISARTLNRHLQKESTSLKQVVTECRVKKAKQLLVESKLSIEDIAIQLGLSGRRTLDRIFIKQHNTSPAQYRNKHKKLFNNSMTKNTQLPQDNEPYTSFAAGFSVSTN